MRIIKMFLALCLAVGATAPLPAHAALNQTSVIVPVHPAGQLQLSEVELTLTLDNPSPIALKITGPRGAVRITRAMNLTNAATDCFDDSTVPGGMVCFAEMPTPGAPVNDNVLIIKALHGSSTSPIEANKVRVLLQFPRVDQAQCTGGITSQERWVIDVVGGAPRILSVSSLSFDRKTQSPPACSTGRRVVPPNEGLTASFPPSAPIGVQVH